MRSSEHTKKGECKKNYIPTLAKTTSFADIFSLIEHTVLCSMKFLLEFENSFVIRNAGLKKYRGVNLSKLFLFIY